MKRRRARIRPLALLAFAGLPLACGAPAAADYSATTLAGDSVALADLRGQVVLLNAWATWCAPCRTEIPVLQELHERRKGEGVRVVGVSVDDATARDEVDRFARELGMSYEIWHDPADRISATFLFYGIPSTIVLDREGREQWRHLGPVERDDPALERALDAALSAR